MLREKELREQLVKLWMEDYGQRETHGKNRSPLIDQINKEIGMGASSGAPYCIAGLLVRGVKRLCAIQGLRNPVYMTASTQSFWNHAPEKYRYIGPAPKLAMIGILQNRANGSQGHGFGIREYSLNKYLTIEYNTNKAGSRDGDGVWTLTRYEAGTASKRMRGFVDVVRMIIDANPDKCVLDSQAQPEAPKAPEARTLKKGMKGEDVTHRQLQLKALGYPLTGTGFFGDATETAVKRFSLSQGLQGLGIIGPKVSEALDRAVAKKKKA